MRIISADTIENSVYSLALKACTILPGSSACALEQAYAREQSPFGREALGQLIKNAETAKRNNIPLCQDTGMAVVFMEIGQDVHIEGGLIANAVNSGVRR
ncbi:MAG TPA: fumarate hydratase, partial [Clostridia bacterium]|nr:fumarate hydratase [Clostridia bacterium]